MVENPAIVYTGPGSVPPLTSMPPTAKDTCGPASSVQGPVSDEEQGSGPEVYMLVLRDLVERSDFGAEKYGHALRTTAEIDFLVNAYQEAIDLCIYLRGEIAKRGLDKAK